MKKLFVFGIVFFCFGVACERVEVAPPAEANLRDLSHSEIELARSSSGFAIELFHQLHDEQTLNQFFSPYSIHQALSMAMNGNEGDVLAEFQSALKYEGIPLGEVNKAARDLTDLLQKMDPKVQLSIANAIWFDQEYQLQAPFRDMALNYYKAEVAPMDMKSSQSVGIINDWIARQTQDQIKDMLDYIHPDAVMYLVNAIFFKADWKYTFDAQQTKQSAFITSEGKEVMVEMMDLNGEATFSSYMGQDLHYFEIPYSTGQFNMGILYNPGGDLKQAVAQLSAENLKTWQKNSSEANFILKMPKFKLQHKMKNMKGDLIDMGLVRPFAFHPDNFTKLLSIAPEEELKIDRVIHDAIIEVDEKGSEAAAATVVEVVVRTSLPSGPQTIVLNKPFVFMIQEKHSGAILFMGKLADPSLLP